MSGPSFSNIDLWLFELEEGNLSPAQVQQLEMFLLKHPELDVDKDVWKMTKVSSNKEIVFPNTENLIKEREIGWFYFASIASLFLLLFSFPFNSGKLNSKKQLSTNNPKTAQIVLKKEVDKIISQVLPQNLDKRNPVFKNETQSKQKSLTANQSGHKEAKSKVQSNPNLLLASNEIEETIIFGQEIFLTENGKVKDFDYTEDDFSQREEDVLFSSLDDASLIFLKDNSDTPLQTLKLKRKSEEHSFSFQKKMKSFARKIERMANNPVALRNYRDPDFHIPGMLINDVNFSATGTMLATRFQALSRIQWMGKENEQFMNQIALDGYSNVIKGGVGIQLKHSVYANGGINVSDISVTYSPKLSLTKTMTFEPSVRFKMGKKSLDFNRMQDASFVEFDRQNMHRFYPNGQIPAGNSLWYKDLGVGLMMNTEWFFVSAQVDNLFRHKDNIYENDMLNPRRAEYYYSFSAGTDWVSQNKKMSLSPYFVYQKNENLSEAWLGANYRLNWLTVGVGVSSLLDPTASIGVKFKHFSFQYTADYLSSDMIQTRTLSHQITLRIVGKPNRFGKRILNL